MNKLSGVVLVLAGLGIAVFVLASPPDTAAVASKPLSSPAEAPAPPSNVALVATQDKPAGGDGSAKLEVRTVAKAAQPPVQAAQPLPRPPAQIIPPQAAPAALPPRRMPLGQDTASAAPPLDQGGLTREIQRQLKRVGCYAGDINGVWTPAVRRSMKAFTDRVNATLPIEQADHILLAMVQSHQDKACSQTCPAGQGLAGDGRCLPNAIIARAAKKQLHSESLVDVGSGSGQATATAAPAPAPEALSDGRMALTGPQPAAPPTATPDLAEPGARRGAQKGRPADTEAWNRDRRRYLRSTAKRWTWPATTAMP